LVLERVPIAVALAIGGFFLGWVSAWISEWLQPAEEADSADRKTTPQRWPLVKDPLVQGGSALVWAATPFLLAEPWWRWVMAGLIAVPLIQVAVTDLRTHYVYTVVAAIGLVLGLAFGWQVHDVEWWTSVAGAVGGGVAFGVLYLLGRLIYRGNVEAMARGDITIAAMVGAGAGTCTAQALFLGVFLGGVFAVGMLVARRSRYTFMPYGPGLCLGGLASLFWC
jgi:prepilin signal peptidase PulO-like enzyme (type II secretory pathway)